MKIALCFHGYMENAGGMSAFHEAYKYIYRKIIKGNDVDIFVHSWDSKNKESYDKYYGKNTKKELFEAQRDFSRMPNINDVQQWFDEGIDRSRCPWPTNTIPRTLSFLYSRKRSIYLKNEFERENNFEYDCTIVCRFDLGTRGKETPQRYYGTDFNLLLDSDMNNLHCVYWDQFNQGFSDHWFYSNSSVMTKIAGAYDAVFKYYHKDSPYIKSALGGWIESNANDDFSNEMLKSSAEKSNNLFKWPRWKCIDNHKLYKWFFYENNIPLCLVDITRDL